jgi:alkylation response protein AidB-like acyl-CoA dehydrogenase
MEAMVVGTEMHDLSTEQSLMRQTCREYVDRVVIPFIRANREREWLFEPEARLPASILAGADSAGLRSLGVPGEYGGVDLEPQTEAQTFAIIATELARGDVGIADKMAQNWKISVLLRSLAPKHLQDEWFPRYMSDPSFLMAHCLTEPKGASDRWLPYNVPEANMDTVAVLDGGQWVINGRKQFISNGYDASLFVVYANTNKAVGMLQGTSSFLVPREAPGLTVTRCNETIGGRYMNNGEIVFEDCQVPEDHLLARDDALGKAAIYFRPGKILQAAKNLGIGVAAFDDTARFVQQHVQGGRVLIKHQAVALRLAQMSIKLDAVAAFLRRAARAVDQDLPEANRLCNEIKVFASEEILEVCKQAMELHGGNGAMIEMGIEKYLRDASVFLHMDATVDISCFKIIRELFPETAGAYAGAG